jgi:hypothetical protein
MTNLPRGIRNNNPGNIRHAGIAWQGLANPPSDGAFCIFTEPKWGIRALAVLLRNYKRKHGLDTIVGIINRFAPSVENNTTAYIAHVCKTLGVEADTRRDIESEVVLLPLAKAIIRHENGQQPYSDEQILEDMRC